MALQSVFLDTELPDIIIDEIIEKFSKLETEESKIISPEENKKIRNADNAWVNVDHWIAGFLNYYIDYINKKNFKYAIDGIDADCLQYSEYKEGQHYTWHCDDSISARCTMSVSTLSNEFGGPPAPYVNEKIGVQFETSRKLSFSLQLSDESDYEGGELQFLSDENASYYAPKKKGTLIIFDSRAQHRVTKVRSGVRRSLVGWVNGPRWQ